jgi:hypothetical protein
LRLDLEIIARTVAVVLLGSESPRMGSFPKDDSRFDEQAVAVGSIPKHDDTQLDKRSVA